MFIFALFPLLFILPSLLVALKCHQVANANLMTPPETQATECMSGSLSCLKLIDHTSKTFSKQCQQYNCTAGSMMNAPAQCTNTSQAGRESMICCCYGDGCNSASVTTTWLTMISVVGLSIGPAFLV